MAQISASVKDSTIEVVRKMAEEEKRTFSAMVDIILTNVSAEWILSKTSKKQSKKSKS